VRENPFYAPITIRQTDIAEVLAISDATAMRYRRRAYALLIECLRRRQVAD
jgi:hypothetical protein